MEHSRKFPVLHGQNHLDQSGHSGRRFQVPDIGLDRSQTAVRGIVFRLSLLQPRSVERFFDPLHLDRIAQLGTGSVELQIGNRLRFDPGIFICGGQYIGLGFGIGSGQRIGASAMVHRRPFDNGIDMISIDNCPAQGFQEHSPYPFSFHISVGPPIECFASTVRGQHPHLAGCDHGSGKEHQAYAPGNGSFAFTLLDGPDGPMNRHQRR